ncbi:unnamed protein product, partial [Rotaria socialis]
MHPNNNLPKFKGSADERPVGFLSEFEIRTATLVEKNDTLLIITCRDNERTMDFLERLKSLMIEIDPNCNEEWLIRKFVEKIRFDIRARLDFDANLTMRELIKKILTIESNIDELKIVEDLRRTALQKRKPPISITTNNISFIDSSDQYAPSSSNKPTDHKQNYNQHSHNNN